MTDIYERLADENEPAPATAPAAQLTGDQASNLMASLTVEFRRAGLPSFVEVESACIVDGLFHSLALLY